MKRVNIEAERARLQMTQEQLAKELGVSPNTLRNYIKGGNIPYAVLVKLSTMTGGSYDYLLHLE